MKKNAFTLAEVLVVIAIIGVVATLTLPNLSRNTSDVDTVAKVKKTVATLQTALDMAKDKYGEDLSTWTASDSSSEDKATRYGTRLSEFLSVSKNCGTNTNQGCFSSSSITAITGSAQRDSIDQNSSYYKIILNDGVSVGFQSSSYIYFDIDGPSKGFNVRGRDIFYLNYSNNNIYWRVPLDFENVSGTNSCRSGTASYCTGWVMNFENVDYIKCSGLTRTNTTCN